MNTMKGKMVCLSFWWKASEADWGWYWLSLVEKIAISVTSPDLGDADDILLGVFQAVSSKGSDQADVILNLLQYYDIVDQTFAVCCDTTSSNTSVFSGAIVLLCTILNTPLLWFPCRRHMLAVNISHFIGSFTGEKTKAPWGVVCQTSEGLANSQEWDWKLSRLDHPYTKLPVKLCSLGKGPSPWTIRSFVSYLLG